MYKYMYSSMSSLPTNKSPTHKVRRDPRDQMRGMTCYSFLVISIKLIPPFHHPNFNQLILLLSTLTHSSLSYTLRPKKPGIPPVRLYNANNAKMAAPNPKAFPLANAQLTNQVRRVDSFRQEEEQY
jgi:hypothetical protein